MILSIIVGLFLIALLDSGYTNLRQFKKKKRIPWLYWLAVLLSARILIVDIPDNMEMVWKALLLGACLRAYHSYTPGIDLIWGALLSLITAGASLLFDNILPESLNVPLISLCTWSFVNLPIS